MNVTDVYKELARIFLQMTRIYGSYVSPDDMRDEDTNEIVKLEQDAFALDEKLHKQGAHTIHDLESK